MTVQELIWELQQLPQELEVQLAHQPNWPFALRIGGVVLDEGFENDEDNDDGYQISPEEGFTPIVYIFEAGQVGYLPSSACDVIGW